MIHLDIENPYWSIQVQDRRENPKIVQVVQRSFRDKMKETHNNFLLSQPFSFKLRILAVFFLGFDVQYLNVNVGFTVIFLVIQIHQSM